jgi:NAD(P)-dependent dehydrogenase (short-subunit alcohol dehydrogenase family)
MTSQRIWLISGFGRELTTQLLERGDRVVGTVRDMNKVSDLTARHPEAFHLEVLDVTDTAAIHDVVDRTFEQLGRIDVVVSNAGYGLSGAAEELTDAQVEHIIATNLTGSIQLIRSALRHLRRQGVAASSRSRPTAGRSHPPATRCTTPRSGVSRALWAPAIPIAFTEQQLAASRRARATLG